MTTQRFPLNVPFAITMTIFHAGAVVALFFATIGSWLFPETAVFFFPNWKFALLAFWFWAVQGNSVTFVNHRLLTHRSFKIPVWLEYPSALVSCLALQGPLMAWVAKHWIHHIHTEKSKKDPHTPRDGGWWAHIDWMLHPDPALDDKALIYANARGLEKKKFYLWLENFFWLPITIWGLLCLYFLGIPGLLWGVFLPTVVSLQLTWLVNSGTHMWGTKRFRKENPEEEDDSRNCWWIALLTFGEGWHHNHHHAPHSARHGLARYEIDITWYEILLLKKLGIATRVSEFKLPPGMK